MISDNNHIELILNSIPGGVIICEDNAPYPMTYLSEGFLALTGYDRTQIGELYHNNLLEMVHPEDIELVRKTKSAAATESYELELRLRCRAGYKWVLNKGRPYEAGGKKQHICISVDISATKQAQKKLIESAESHKLLMSQTNDVMFEWDIQSDQLDFSVNWKKKFFDIPVRSAKELGKKLEAFVASEDRAVFEQLLSRIRSGEPMIEVELRTLDSNKNVVWSKVRTALQLDSAGLPIKAIGVIMDIDAEKRNQQDLIEQAERDPLTKLYNKVTVQRLIEKELKNKGKNGTLLILDIDDFKNVNDTFGHLFGDGVLTEIAGRLTAFFEDAFIGRIGGDEFVIYLKNTSLDKAAEIARRAIMHLKSVFSQASLTYMVSCSIGIAQKKLHGNTFEELYRRSDLALYKAKKQGKQQYVIYDNTMGDENLSAVNMVFDDIAPLESSELNNYLIENVLKILYSPDSIEVSIQKILEFLGKYFNVSRVYIFENSKDNKYCSNTFEWCNESIPPQIDRLQNLCYATDMNGFFGTFNAEGVCYYTDIQELRPNLRGILSAQGIKSILITSIQKDNEPIGYIGFDDCENMRSWTKEQIKTLTFISRILTDSLFKGREHHRAVSLSQKVLSLLDHVNTRIYVLAKQNNVILYTNRIAIDQMLTEQEENFLQRLFQGELQDILSGAQTACRQKLIFLPEIKKWFIAAVTDFSWDNAQANLLTFTDVTAFRKNNDTV